MKKALKVEELMAENGGIRFGTRLVKPEQFRVKVIRTHVQPHWEELVAIELLRIFGEAFFPGILEATVEYAAKGCNHPDAYELLEKEGVLLLGIGDTPFNEHETNTRGLIIGECTATLVAKLLGFEKEEGVLKILAYALRSDTTPMAPHDMSQVLKAIYARHPDDQSVGVNWARLAIETQILAQLDFFGETSHEFKTKCQLPEPEAGTMNIGIHGGRQVSLVWVKSSLMNMSAFCRAKNGLDAAVVVQQSGDGQYYISVNKRHRVQGMPNVVQKLRIAEYKVAGKLGIPVHWSSLSDGAVQGSPWFRDSEKKTNAIYAGGNAADADKPKSKLTLAEVISAVRAGLIATPIHGADGDESSGPREAQDNRYQGQRPERREHNPRHRPEGSRSDRRPSQPGERSGPPKHQPRRDQRPPKPAPTAPRNVAPPAPSPEVQQLFKAADAEATTPLPTTPENAPVVPESATGK